MKILSKTFYRFTAGLVAALFGFNMVFIPATYAQVPFLPEAGTMINMTPKFDPMMVKGIKLYPDNPFKFDFIVDTGDMTLSRDQIKDQGQKLASYFLASLTTPEKEMWVNLSPYEKSRIIPPAFGDTEMGKELLSEDYMLKQIMATALYPERQLGQEFWAKVYAQAQREFGTTNVPVNTFNKVWIVPDQAVVYENAQLNSVFVVKSSLKVMLEQDYLAANKHKATEQYGMSEELVQEKTTTDAVASMSSRIIKEVVIPALEREVNEGKNFAGLRQVYQSLILAAWYKNNLKDNVLAQGYVDRNKTLGIDTQDKQITEKIYQQYLQAYRKGAYNYIKEETDPVTQQIIPRKYFSGGIDATQLNPANLAMATGAQAMRFKVDMAMSAGKHRLLSLGVGLFLALGVATGAQAAGVLIHGHDLTFDGKKITSVEQFNKVSTQLGPNHIVTVDGWTYKTTGHNEPSIWYIINLRPTGASASPGTSTPAPTVAVTPQPAAPVLTPSAGTTVTPVQLNLPSTINFTTLSNLRQELGASNLLKGDLKTWANQLDNLAYDSPERVDIGKKFLALGGYAEANGTIPSKYIFVPSSEIGNSLATGSTGTGVASGPGGPPKQPVVESVPTTPSAVASPATGTVQSAASTATWVGQTAVATINGLQIEKRGPDYYVYQGYEELPESVLSDPFYSTGLQHLKSIASLYYGDQPDRADMHELASLIVKGKGRIPLDFEYTHTVTSFPLPVATTTIGARSPNAQVTMLQGGPPTIGTYTNQFSLNRPLLNSYFSANPPVQPTTSASASPLQPLTVMTLSSGSGNPAMVGPPFGGIDLEKLILYTKGAGGVRTAFSAPRILQMLLEAQGLFPQIESIEFVTVAMVNML